MVDCIYVAGVAFDHMTEAVFDHMTEFVFGTLDGVVVDYIAEAAFGSLEVAVAYKPVECSPFEGKLVERNRCH